MIELQWVIRTVRRGGTDPGFYGPDFQNVQVSVLQYRVHRHYVLDRDDNIGQHWSEWMDVPTVIEP